MLSEKFNFLSIRFNASKGMSKHSKNRINEALALPSQNSKLKAIMMQTFSQIQQMDFHISDLLIQHTG